MRVLDLFSGIGAMSLGLERAGMETIAFCEIDPLCRKMLAEKWPGVPCHDDVRTMQFPDCDVIAGGFPCQDISVAGKGAGLSGERSGLYREVLRAIRLVGPRYVILENVAVLLSRGLGIILGDLAEIGYDAEWHCIPASSLGAPHRRDRIWIVAYSSGAGRREDTTGALGNENPNERRATEYHHLADCDGQGDTPGSLADPSSGRCGKSRAGKMEQPGKAGTIRRSDDLADTTCELRDRGGEQWPTGWAKSPNSGQAMSHPDGPRLALWESIASHDGTERTTSLRDRWWPPEPSVGRVVDGFAGRVDQLRMLGNSLIPQIPELIGRAIIQIARC